jgi:hypothetical protein
MRKLRGLVNYMDKKEFLKERKVFLGKMIKKNKKKFLGSERKCIKKEYNKWKSIKEKKKQKIKEEIRKDQRHDRYLNLCIFPFIQVGKTELVQYRFVRPEPLVELNLTNGVKNFDFLLYNNKSRMAIFGEVKTSISSLSRGSSVLNEVKAKIREVRKNLDYIKQTYLKTEKSIGTEFVIAVPSQYAGEMTNVIYRNQESIITWAIHLIEELSDEPPGPRKYTIKMCYFMTEDDAKRINSIHNDRNFRKLIGKGIATQMETNFQVFPSSVHLKYLKALNNLIRIEGRKKILKKEDIVNFFYDQEFFSLCSSSERKERNNNFINKKIEEIIKKALEINFIKKNGKKGVYSVKTKHTTIRSIQKETLEPKYMKYKLKQKEEEFRAKIRIECFERLKNEFEEKWGIQETLDV